MFSTPFFDALLGHWENDDLDEEDSYVSSNPFSYTSVREADPR